MWFIKNWYFVNFCLKTLFLKIVFQLIIDFIDICLNWNTCQTVEQSITGYYYSENIHQMILVSKYLLNLFK